MIPAPPPIYEVILQNAGFPSQLPVGTTIHVCRVQLKSTNASAETLATVVTLLEMCDENHIGDALKMLQVLSGQLFGQSTHRTFVRLERDALRQEVRIFAIRPPLNARKIRDNN
jgi:hypothetical protein